MRRYHIVAFTPDLTKALAIRTPAGWLLPRLDGDPNVDLPQQIHATLSDIVAEVEVLHEALVVADRPAKVYHGYCAALVSLPVRHSDIVAVSVSELLSSPFLVPLQRQALTIALSRSRTPTAPFDTAGQANAALAWAEQQIGMRTDARVLSAIRHRCTRHEYVVKFLTDGDTFHFKASAERVPDEAHLTDLLRAISPAQFPETLVLDRGQHRWVYRELRGDVLMGACLNVETAVASVRAYAVLQKHVSRSAVIEAHLASRRVDAVALFERVDSVLRHARLGQDASGVEARHLDEWLTVAGEVAHICATIDAWGLPMTLALSDFWPGNVIATPEGFGFIDLEYSFWSYPFLSLWQFGIDAERFLRAEGAVRRAIEETFIAEWANLVRATDMTRALTHLPLLGRLLRVLIESRRLSLREEGLGAELPGWYRAEYLDPFVQRLLDTVRAPVTKRAFQP